MKKIIFSLITVVLSLFVVEMGLRSIYFIKNYTLHKGKKGMPQSAAHAGLDWASRYFAEEGKTVMRFEPFYEWRREEFHGKYVNISADGVRKTWNPEPAHPQNLKKVFCFGGSTMWGVGSRDDFTIPSLLSKKLNENGAKYLVINYGERVYNMMQEMVFLLLQLKRGNVPDYVIFYDGVNEVLSAGKNGRAGLIYDVEGVRERLARGDEGIYSKIAKEIRRTEIYRSIAELRAIAFKNRDKEDYDSDENKEKLRVLADKVVADYINNVNFIRGISQVYGFKTIFIWQPVLFTTKSLTPEERKFVWYDNVTKLYELVYDKIGNTKIDQFYNLSTIFDTKKKTLFFTFCHISEEGNDLVASEIYQIFQRNCANRGSNGTGQAFARGGMDAPR